MDFGTTISTISLYLVIFASIYSYISLRNKERMALIDAGGDPTLFNIRKEEKYYVFFVIGVLALSVGSASLLSFLLVSTVDGIQELSDKNILYLSMNLLFGGTALIFCFFRIRKWIQQED